MADGRTKALAIYFGVMAGSVAAYAWFTMLLLGVFGYGVPFWAVTVAWIASSFAVSAIVTTIRALTRPQIAEDQR